VRIARWLDAAIIVYQCKLKLTRLPLIDNSDIILLPIGR